MKKDFKKCDNPYVCQNLFFLNEKDQIYEYIVDDNVVGYGILRDNKYDMIQIYIDKIYENNHYGNELFQSILKLVDKDIYVSTKENNIKAIKIISNNNGKEIGRNNSIITYKIDKVYTT